eukprot:jgi/Psemu1/28830/gm1.28830_g
MPQPKEEDVSPAPTTSTSTDDPDEWNAVALIHKDNFPDGDRSAGNLARKYTALYCETIPTGNPNCPEEVRLVKQIKKLIGDRARVGDCDDEYDLEEGYKNSNSHSSGEDDDLDISENNVPPLCQPLQPTQSTQPTQADPPNVTIVIPAKRSYTRNRVTGKEIISLLRETVKIEREDRQTQREPKKMRIAREQREEHMRTITPTIVNISNLFADQLAAVNNKELKRQALVFQRDGFGWLGWMNLEMDQAMTPELQQFELDMDLYGLSTLNFSFITSMADCGLLILDLED